MAGVGQQCNIYLPFSGNGLNGSFSIRRMRTTYPKLPFVKVRNLETEIAVK
jgi:hypothetical protein